MTPSLFLRLTRPVPSPSTRARSQPPSEDMGTRFHEMEQESVVPPQGRGVRYRVGVGGVLILTAYCDRGIPRRSVSVAESDFSPEDVRYLERWLDSHYPAASRLKLMA